MKLKQYLNEGKTSIDVPPDEQNEFLETLLTKNCKQYLNAIKGTQKLLYRGTEQVFKIAEITPRKNRNPKDMPLEYHKLLDKLFNTKFGWKPRSTGIFCSGRHQAAVYGSVYSIWPIGKFKFIWSPKIHDLYLKIYRDSSTFKNAIAQPAIQDLVDTYQSNNLKSAIYNENEVMLICNSYYLINDDIFYDIHNFLKYKDIL